MRLSKSSPVAPAAASDRVIHHVATPHLEVAYEACGPADGRPVVLVHGWPDDVRCWDAIAPVLAQRGLRVLAPYSRGCGETRFWSSAAERSGSVAAFGQDLIEFMQSLALNDAVVVGHDMGARAAYVAAAVAPERISSLVAMAAPYSPAKTVRNLSHEMARVYWYAGLVSPKAGRDAFQREGRRLCQHLWSAWSPGWSFNDTEFERTAESWGNEDWAKISMNAYLEQWDEQPSAGDYEELEELLASAPKIQVPTVMLQGEQDRDNLPVMSEGNEESFSNGYERILLKGVGHFIPREAPREVLGAIERALAEPSDWTAPRSHLRVSEVPPPRS